jgi:hypothetical protein
MDKSAITKAVGGLGLAVTVILGAAACSSSSQTPSHALRAAASSGADSHPAATGKLTVYGQPFSVSVQSLDDTHADPGYASRETTLNLAVTNTGNASVSLNSNPAGSRGSPGCVRDVNGYVNCAPAFANNAQQTPAPLQAFITDSGGTDNPVVNVAPYNYEVMPGQTVTISYQGDLIGPTAVMTQVQLSVDSSAGYGSVTLPVSDNAPAAPATDPNAATAPANPDTSSTAQTLANVFNTAENNAPGEQPPTPTNVSVINFAVSGQYAVANFYNDGSNETAFFNNGPNWTLTTYCGTNIRGTCGNGIPASTLPPGGESQSVSLHRIAAEAVTSRPASPHLVAHPAKPRLPR